MKFTIDDKRVLAVLHELSFRLGVDEEAIVRATLRELAEMYVRKPTLGMQFARMLLKKQGGDVVGMDS